MEEMTTGTSKSSTKVDVTPFTSYQKFAVAVLSFLQFTIILDFMILSPLGAILMPTLKISASQFGLVVSVYAFSAGASGILAAGFADRFDRKKLLLFFYTGFVLGTLLCGLAPTYEFLLFARLVTGLFGGVIGSIVFAIITDLFPLEKRGRVMGFVQTSFAASQIMGVPIGLYFANMWGWHAPFLMIVAIAALAGVILMIYLKPINEHLRHRVERHPFTHLWETVSNRHYLQAFAATALLATGGFMVMPFSSAFTVHNLGISLETLPMVYMITGVCAIVAGPIVGRLSDSWGKFKVFFFGSALSIAMILIYTHLGPTSLTGVIAISSIMFIGISSRMIPSQALMSAVPTPDTRGSFMSIGASLQQVSGGIASVIAGWLISIEPDGKIQHFERIGYVVAITSLITLVQMFFIHREVSRLVSARAKP